MQNFDQFRDDARAIWDYHQLGEEPRASDVGLVLGSHDLGVADHAVDLFERGMYPLVVFSGSNSPTTRDRFPEGEAIAYRNRAIERGIPSDAILLETQARNTGENFTLAREVLAEVGVHPRTVLVVSKPYMQRRALATGQKLWPEVTFSFSSESMSYEDYVTTLGDEKLVIDMIVGDLQRILIYPEAGFAVPQDVPDEVASAYRRLVEAGFTSRLVAA